MDDEPRSSRAEWIDRLVAESTTPVRVQLSPEQEVGFPVEVFVEHGPGFVGPGALGLSQELETDLIEWLRWWQHHISPGGDEVVGGGEAEWHRWGQERERLRKRLQSELGGEFRVRID
jgi:hypothetical protein